MKNRRNDIERYLRGELSPAEMHVLEKEALNDPFLAEALEGVEQAGTDNFLYDLHALNRSLHDRTRKRKSKTIRMWGWTTGIAATVLLVAVSGFLVVNLIRQQNDRQLALHQKSNGNPGDGPVLDTVAKALDRQQVPAPAEKPHHRTDGPATESASRGREQTPAKVEKADDASQVSHSDLPAENDDTQSKKEEEKDAAPVSEKDVTKEVPNAVAGATGREDVKIPDRAEGAVVERAAEEREFEKRKRASSEKGASQPGAAVAVQPEALSLRGKVVSAEDGDGLPGVTVMVKGTSIGSVTDANGDYKIDLPSLDSKLIVSFVGFETTEVDVSGQQHVDVRLKEDVSQLNEVVVTGYGSPSNQTVEEATAFHVAEPQGGKGAFKKYLVQSLKYPDAAVRSKAEGKVTVRFTVEPDGALTDFEVLRGIGSGCEEELIRLIRNGPAWRPATQGTAPVADKVKVRFKFELPR